MKDERDGFTALRYWAKTALWVYGWSSLLMMRLVAMVRKEDLGLHRLLIRSLMGRVLSRRRGMDGDPLRMVLRGLVQVIV